MKKSAKDIKRMKNVINEAMNRQSSSMSESHRHFLSIRDVHLFNTCFASIFENFILFSFFQLKSRTDGSIEITKEEK